MLSKGGRSIMVSVIACTFNMYTYVQYIYIGLVLYYRHAFRLGMRDDGGKIYKKYRGVILDK